MPVLVLGKRVDAYPDIPPEAERGAVRRVTVIGEPILRKICAPVVEFGTSELAALIDDMFATMRVAEGCGLAANQVDVDLSVFVWDCEDDYGVRHVGHIANPILNTLPADRRNLVEAREGCLSVPGARADLARPDKAIVRGWDMHGNPLVIEGSGYFARALQHETDHLNGGLYVDRVPDRARKVALREMENNREAVFARRARIAAEWGK
ncbi:peptide deformylase [Pseudonocardiaceae bacterium YIM PH 21723]|nr:peptide deformylase [Pseudonocardiaceae bacterium YIM PH 21723]